MGGHVAQARFNPLQPNLNDSINSQGYGKLTPVYKRHAAFGGGGAFATLNQDNLSSNAVPGKHLVYSILPGHNDSKGHMPQQTSIADTTNVTGNLSTFRGSPLQANHSHSNADANKSQELGAGNIFNFAP